eukprot:8106258-Alexandrium_andersonii.AAC.1
MTWTSARLRLPRKASPQAKLAGLSCALDLVLFKRDVQLSSHLNSLPSSAICANWLRTSPRQGSLGVA